MGTARAQCELEDAFHLPGAVLQSPSSLSISDDFRSETPSAPGSFEPPIRHIRMDSPIAPRDVVCHEKDQTSSSDGCICLEDVIEKVVVQKHVEWENSIASLLEDGFAALRLEAENLSIYFDELYKEISIVGETCKAKQKLAVAPPSGVTTS